MTQIHVMMRHPDYLVFADLLAKVHDKAFCEKLTPLHYSKAVSLSWLIYECTGEMLSYKTLSAYVKAVLDETPQKINPTNATLGILAHYVNDGPVNKLKNRQEMSLYWYTYRSLMLRKMTVIS